MVVLLFYPNPDFLSGRKKDIAKRNNFLSQVKSNQN